MPRLKADGLAEYVRIQLALKTQIEEGLLPPKALLPSDKELAVAYGVSLGTVIKAISNLADDGYLTRVQGKGTFVNEVIMPPNAKRYLRLRRSIDPAEEDQLIATKVLYLHKVPDLNTVVPGRRLFGSGEAPGFELRREMSCSGRPTVHSVVCLTQTLCPNLDKFTASELAHRSVYWLLKEKYRLESKLRQELIKLAMPDDPLADFFRIKPLEPFLVIESCDFINPETPFIYHLALCMDRQLGIFREL